MDIQHKDDFQSRIAVDCAKHELGHSGREINFIRKFENMRSRSAAYIYIHPYFSADECAAMKTPVNSENLCERWNPIDWDLKLGREQLLISQSMRLASSRTIPECLAKFIAVFQEMHPETIYTKLVMMQSHAGCEEQLIHTDDGEMSCSNCKWTKFAHLSFSIIIALEPSNNPTRIIVAENRKPPLKLVSKLIEPGGIFLYRGDFPHGGAAIISTIYEPL